MRYYSSNGDKGMTSFGRSRILSKADISIEFVGNLDKAQAALGFAAAEAAKHPVTHEINECLVWMQRALFQAGVTIMDAYDTKSRAAWSWEAQLHEVERFCELFAPKEPLKAFVLPGGSELAARIELARVAIRELERSYCHLIDTSAGVAFAGIETDELASMDALPFFNRLSSLAFVLARRSNELLEVSERNL